MNPDSPEIRSVPNFQAPLEQLWTILQAVHGGTIYVCLHNIAKADFQGAISLVVATEA